MELEAALKAMIHLNLTSTELTRIVDKLKFRFGADVDAYDARKYPLDAYDDLLASFASPKTVSGGDIRRALEWKYGHWMKADYPDAHRKMAVRILAMWPKFSRLVAGAPEAGFHYGMAELKGAWSAPYITVIFLLHLLRPGEVPIMDQHTYRAMNNLIGGVRSDSRAKKKPSTFADLETYAEFFGELKTFWARSDTNITRPRLDRGLMVYGQRLSK
jgi:hypothetical protein